MQRTALVGASIVGVVAVGGAALAWATSGPVQDRLEVEVIDVAEAPIPETQDASAVWTGEEFVVWGGGTGDQATGGVGEAGAAYTPATDTWRALAAAPLEARERHTAVWTGDEMIVWGGTRRHHGVGDLLDGARYDPGSDRWREMADAPPGTDRSSGQAVIIDDQVVIGAGYGPSGREETKVLVYDLSADRWSTLQAGGPVIQLLAVGGDVALLTLSPRIDGPGELGVELFEVSTGEIRPMGRLELERPVTSAGLLEHDGTLTLLVEPTDDEASQVFRVNDAGPMTLLEATDTTDLPGPVALYSMAELSPVLSDDSRRIVFGWASGMNPYGIDLVSGATAHTDELGGLVCRNGAAYAVDGERLFVWGEAGCRADGDDEGTLLLDVTWEEREDPPWALQLAPDRSGASAVLRLSR